MDASSDAPAAEAAATAVLELLRVTDPGAFGPHFRHPRSMTESHLPSALPAARASRQVGIAAGRLTVSHVLRARGQGEDWTDVATALDLHADGSPDVTAAYLLALGRKEDDPWWSPGRGVVWQCGACWAEVRDFGPEAGGPDDREVGHGPRCARHDADLAAWNAVWS